MPVTDGGGHSPVDLQSVLRRSQDFGFLGPGPLEPQHGHARGFTRLAQRVSADQSGPEGPRILDLGSGGGLPGLVMAQEWPEATFVLLDAHGRRTDFLRAAVDDLELGDRVSVIQDRAESSGRAPTLRAAFDGVVARSFGPPATLAECAAPFLRVGGWLIVSEPPVSVDESEGTAGDGQDTRWPAASLEPLGLEPVELVREGFTYQILRQVQLCPDRFPRRNGVPAKRPLF